MSYIANVGILYPKQMALAKSFKIKTVANVRSQ